MAAVKTERTIISHFVKWGSDPIRLWSLTVIQYEQNRYRPWEKPWLSCTEYDVEWSKKYGYLYHASGCGGGHRIGVEGIYHVHNGLSLPLDIREKAARWCSAADRPPWIAKCTQKIRRRNATRRLRQLPMSFAEMQPGWDILDWLEHSWNAHETEAVYCSECDDWLPEDDTCDHVWWCSKTGCWSTPSERCKCTDREKCST